MKEKVPLCQNEADAAVFFVKFYWKYNFMSLNENGRSLYIKKFYYKEKN